MNLEAPFSTAFSGGRIPPERCLNSTEFTGWMHRNCWECKKAGDASVPGSSSCDFFEALLDCACGFEIPQEVAIRFGRIEKGEFRVYKKCPEFKAVET